MYDDSIEIQKFFITARDNVCRNGEGLGFSSPAISYTHRHLTKAVDEQTSKKKQIETPAEEIEASFKQKVKVYVSGLVSCMLGSLHEYFSY